MEHLTVAALPIALYQYFYISLPDMFVTVEQIAWLIYFSPLELLGWSPTLASVDPLITLLPAFGMLFVLWSAVLSVVFLSLYQLRR